MKTLNLTICLFFFPIICLIASTDSLKYPRVGEKCPDFLLTDVQGFGKTEVTLDDFKGKWLFLDFWGEYCAACIRAFPKMDSIQRTFSKDVQVFFVGVPAKGKDPNTIRKLYELHRKKLDLKIPIAYDSKLAAQFATRAFPHIVVVDPTGIVRHITSVLSQENVEDLIAGRPAAIQLSYNNIEAKSYDGYDKEIPFLLKGNGGEEEGYLYRSVLAHASDRVLDGRLNIGTDRIEMLNFPLSNMFQYAYVGNPVNEFHNVLDSVLYVSHWPVALIEVKDSTLFSPDRTNKANMFSYSAHVRDAYMDVASNPKAAFRDLLKKDLNALFPYTASMEKRMMPYYCFHINEGKLQSLKSKSTQPHFEFLNGNRGGFKAQKMPVSRIIHIIVDSSPDYDPTIPMIPDGEDVYIDIELKSVYFQDIIDELRQKGITITKDEKEMNVLVIRDK